MKTIFIATITLGTLFAVYLAAAMAPAIGVVALNIGLAPSECWIADASIWLTDAGVPYSSLVIVGSYCAAVFFPAIKLATWVAFENVDVWLDDKLGECYR